MFIVKYYLTSAILAFILAWFSPNIVLTLILTWIGLSMSGVTAAYLLKKPSIFRKKQDGSIPFYIRWLFVPFLLGAALYNAWARKNDSVPAIQQIEDNLFLACRLFPSDVEELKHLGVRAILDVTAEFDGLDWTAQSEDLAYLNVPVLDHQSPSEEILLAAINWIENHRRAGRGVVVHCALGRGRSVLVMAAYLLSKHPKMTVREVMEKIQGVRRTANLNSHQLKSLVKIHNTGNLDLRPKVWLIANPVSGGGKWPQNREFIEQRLSPQMQLTIKETTADMSARSLAKQAIEGGATTIIACGGDGTLTEVASQLVDTDLNLGIIPFGTANALAHALFGTRSQIMPVEVACLNIEQGIVKRIDTAWCNQQLMLLVAAVGFEQKMIETADREEKNEGGQLAYIRALWDAVEDNESLELQVEIDDKPAQTIITCSLVVANAAPFTTVLAQGGGEPDVEDGKLDVTWLPPQASFGEHMFTLSELVMPKIFGDTVSGDVNHAKVRKINIYANRDLKFAVDGENYQAQQIKIIVNPTSLNVLVAPNE